MNHFFRSGDIVEIDLSDLGSGVCIGIVQGGVSDHCLPINWISADPREFYRWNHPEVDIHLTPERWNNVKVIGRIDP